MTDPPAPICVGCKVEFELLKHGRRVITRIRGRMYELWSGAELRCPICKTCITLIPPQVVSFWTDDDKCVAGAIVMKDAKE